MEKDEASLSMLGEVLGSLRKVRDLKLCNFSWTVSLWILEKLLLLLKTTLRSIMVSESHCSFMPSIATDEISIGLDGFGVEDSCMIINSLLRFCSLVDRHASVFIFSLKKGRLELFAILHENMKSLYILGTEPYVAMAKKSEMPLERLCLKIASPDLALALSEHVQNGSLSQLTHLSIAAVQLLKGHKISLIDCLFEKEWPQLTSLTLSNLTEKGFFEFFLVANEGTLKNISQLRLIFDERFPFFSWEMLFLVFEYLPFLKQLAIHQFETNLHFNIFEELAIFLRQGERCLQKIDLSHNCSLASGKLSILLENRFPELHTLILSDFNLNCNSLKILARAKVQGRMPELKHLDISLNDEIRGHLDLLFDNSSSSTWSSLQSLNVHWSRSEAQKAIERKVCSPDLSLLFKKSSLLGSLRELRVSVVNNRRMRVASLWGCLTTLQFVCWSRGDSGILSSVVAAVKDNLLPRLETIRIVSYSDNDSRWRLKLIDDEEKTTIGARQENLAILRAANIAVFEIELADEKRLTAVGVNSFPFTQ